MKKIFFCLFCWGCLFLCFLFSSFLVLFVGRCVFITCLFVCKLVATKKYGMFVKKKNVVTLTKNPKLVENREMKKIGKTGWVLCEKCYMYNVALYYAYVQFDSSYFFQHFPTHSTTVDYFKQLEIPKSKRTSKEIAISPLHLFLDSWLMIDFGLILD